MSSVGSGADSAAEPETTWNLEDRRILSIVVTGSVAFDYIMSFPGYFKDHILPEKIDILSVSFLVDSLKRQRGGCATNIAYNLALLGERPTIMATVGQDFAEYRAWLEARGVDTSGILVIQDDFTASFFVSTDQRGSQIASFYTGAMSKAGQLSFRAPGSPAGAIGHRVAQRSGRHERLRPGMLRTRHSLHL